MPEAIKASGLFEVMKRSLLYKPLRDRAGECLPYLKFVDLQKGQMNQPTQNYPIPLPALFIEIGDFRFSNLLDHQQKGAGVLSFYLYLDIVSDSFRSSERENETIEILDRFDELFEAFEGFSVPNITPLVRQTEYKPQYGTRFIMLRMDFATTIDDGKDIQQMMTKIPTPKFNFR